MELKFSNYDIEEYIRKYYACTQNKNVDVKLNVKVSVIGLNLLLSADVSYFVNRKDNIVKYTEVISYNQIYDIFVYMLSLKGIIVSSLDIDYELEEKNNCGKLIEYVPVFNGIVVNRKYGKVLKRHVNKKSWLKK